MKTKHFLATGLAVAMAVLISSQAGAGMWGRNHGPMMGGPGVGHGYAATLSETQREEAAKIEEKYRPQLNEKETALRNKAAELQTAQAKDSTTIGELTALRDELYVLEQDYWSLRDKVNQEISRAIGAGYYGNMGWGAGYCAWHDDHPGMYGSNAAPRMYGQRGAMTGYGRGWCRW